jgi:hypothetical protein
MNKFRSILILAAIFSSTFLSATVTELGADLSVDIPGVVEWSDTTTKGVLSEVCNSQVNSEHFIATRTVHIEDKGLLLAEDEQALNKQYLNIIKVRSSSMKKKEYLLQDSDSTLVKGFLGHRVTYVNQTTKEKIAESLYLQLNGVIYNFVYINRVDFNEKYKNLFFDSISINNPEKAAQFIVKEPFFSTGVWIGLALSFVFFIVLTFIKKDGEHAKWGIPLKRPNCPNCGLKQPLFRKPKNESQLLWGGYNCSKCDTEMDKYGKVKEK